VSGPGAVGDGYGGRVAVKRAYVEPGPADGWRVLVDRVWPRGMTRESLRLDERRPELGPSTELRRWFGHDPERWDEFVRRYRAELDAPGPSAALDELAMRARRGRVTLVYSARDEVHNQARVLAALLEERLGRDRDVPGSAELDRAPGRLDGDSGAALVEAIERLVRAGVAVTTRALEERPAVDLTVQQWRAMVMVAEADGLRIGTIAERVGQSVPSASRLVGRLEHRALVVSERDPADGRASLVRVTERGRRVVGAVLERRRRLIDDALATSPGPLPEGSSVVADALARALEHLT
jgi:uncharacterized protein YeaO (DUF488 family)/DNA-binding MarR family transcriptional regulator